jgi:putative DNA primase/helicase
MGYSLTGSTKERAMAVLHGVGKNGKSTLVELFQDLMGDYRGVANPNTVMQQKYGDATAQYQLAELTGVRFVGISETKRGVELEEAVVKQITGNDTINARAPYGKPFSYQPQFKLWLSTNHKPEIPDGSEAIWDRMRLIPFTQRFTGKDADTKLPEKLREELPGVLAWAVRGCVDWWEHGLGSSKAVEAATSAYRAETDVIDRFFADECVFGPEERVTKKRLYAAWEEWCEGEGEDPGKQNGFTRIMSERGVVKDFKDARKKGGERVWVGIGLQEDFHRTPPEDAEEKSVTPQKSWKHGGGESKGDTLEGDSPNFSRNTPRVENFSENGEKVSPSSKSVTPGVTTPLSFEIEGVTWKYRRA